MAKPSVIFTDNHLLLINKPPKMATQPDLEEWGKKWLNRPFLHAVHRIDKSASGIVVLAKTSKALSRLQESMRSNMWEKMYLTIIEGIIEDKEGTLEDYLFHDSFRAKISSSSEKDAKYAKLSYRVVEEKSGFSLVEVYLHTGRYHQIRIQFASRGYPLLGDKKYGSKNFFQEGAIALHHKKLSFIHPITSEKITFVAPIFAPWPFFSNVTSSPQEC
jgi:23S rRNA pseudouridine1911/1915/1917 synthase